MTTHKNAADETESASNPRDTNEVFGDHFPTLIAILANRLTRGASNYYRHTHGVGVIEWRVLYALRKTGDLSASEIARVTDLDKAAVSRSMRVLERRGFIRVVRTGKADRRIIAVVTPAGRKLQRELHAIAQDRQKAFMQDFAPEQIEAFRTMLTRFLARVPRSAAEVTSKRREGPSADRATKASEGEIPAASPSRSKARSRPPASRKGNAQPGPLSHLSPQRPGRR